jgi:glycine/D-amino acid oxidase-like deaminating enzyme
VYCEVTEPGALYYRAEVEAGVVVVTGPGGRGMTMSPAIAAATFE